MEARNQKCLVALILVLLGGTLIFVIFSRVPELPEVIILPPTPLAVKGGRAPDRWIPRNWTWLRRSCFLVLGQPKQVSFEIECSAVSEKVSSIIAENSLGPPLAESNGVAVWIVPAGRSWVWGAPSTIMPRAHVVTSDQGQATVGVGDYKADLFGHLQKLTVDLSTRLIIGSAIQTNFVATARAQLPYGKALFVLDARHPDSATYRFEIFVTADEIDAGGNKVRGKAPGK
jgi:hypothetical protein